MAGVTADVDSLASKLKGASIVPGQAAGVSIAGKGFKLNNQQDAATIVAEVEGASRVEYLNMEGNSLGVDAAKEIGKALEGRPEFTHALWKDMFTSRLKTEIPIALKHLCGGLMVAGAKLQVLDLSDNASGPIGVEGFQELLRSPVCFSLKQLRLNNMGLGVTGAKKLASALLDLYNNSKNAGEALKLEVFVAGRNRLENPGATALAQVFQKIGTLKEISIPQNGIYHKGVEALSLAFGENPSLEVINLNDNTLTEKGAAFISKVLPRLENLTYLDLGDCLLRSSGAASVATSLSSLSHLSHLNLSYNEVKGEAATRILSSLAPLARSLTHLNLDGNMFGPEACMHLADTARTLTLPLTPLEEDEGDDDDDDEEGGEEEEEEEDDEEGDEEETESDHTYHLGNSDWGRTDEKRNTDLGDVITDLGTLSMSENVSDACINLNVSFRDQSSCDGAPDHHSALNGGKEETPVVQTNGKQWKKYRGSPHSAKHKFGYSSIENISFHDLSFGDGTSLGSDENSFPNGGNVENLLADSMLKANVSPLKGMHKFGFSNIENTSLHNLSRKYDAVLDENYVISSRSKDFSSLKLRQKRLKMDIQSLVPEARELNSIPYDLAYKPDDTPSPCDVNKKTDECGPSVDLMFRSMALLVKTLPVKEQLIIQKQIMDTVYKACSRRFELLMP